MEIGLGMGNASVTSMETGTSLNKVEGKQEAYQQTVELVGQNVQINEIGQEKRFVEAIEKVNKRFLGDGKELSFSIHEKTKQIMVKIVDKQSKEVVKEIPPEKILDMVAEMCENAGLFIDERK